MVYKLFRGVAAFILSLAIAAAVALPVLYYGFLATSAIESSFNKTSYYEAAQQQAMQSVGAGLISTGVPETVLEGTLTVEDIKIIMVDSLGQMSRSVYLLRMDDISQRLEDNINAYAIGEGLSVEEYAVEIAEIVEYVVNVYGASMSFPFGEYLARMQDAMGRLLPWGILGCLVLAVLCVLVIRTGPHGKQKSLRYVAYALSGAGLMLLVAPTVVRIWGGYRRIGLEPEYFYIFMVKHINTLLFTMMLAGALLVAASVAVAILHTHRKRRRAMVHRRAQREQAAAQASHGLPD